MLSESRFFNISLLALAFALFQAGTASLAAQEAAPARVAWEPAKILQKQAQDFLEGRDLLGAEKALAEALREYEKCAGDQESNPAFQSAWCQCRYRVAEVQSALHKVSTAKALAMENRAALQKLVSRFPNEPSFRLEQAKTMHIMALCFREEGKPVEMVAARRHAIAILSKLTADYPGQAEYGRELAKALNHQGAEFMRHARYPEGEVAYREAVQVGQKLVANFPSDPECALQLAFTCNSYALLVRESGRFAGGVDLIRQALQILKKLEADYPDRPQYWHQQITFYRNLAQPLAYLHRGAEEAVAKRAALRLEAKLERLPENARKFLQADDKLMGTIQDLDIDRLLRQAGEVSEVTRSNEQLAKDHPEAPLFRIRLAAARALEASRLAASGSMPEAERLFDEGLAILRKLTVDFPEAPHFRRLLGDFFYSRASLCIMAGNAPEAEKFFKEGTTTYEKLVADYSQVPGLPLAWSNALMNVVMVEKAKGDLPAAISTLAKALEVLKKLANAYPTCPEYRRHVAGTYVTLGNMHLAAQASAEAEAALREGLRTWAKTAADFPDIPDFVLLWGNAYLNMGRFCAEREQYAKAEEAYVEAIRIHDGLLKANPSFIDNLMVLFVDWTWFAGLLEKQKRPADAITCYANAISYMEAALKLAPRQPDFLENLRLALRQRAFLYLAAGKSAEYDADLRRASELEDRLAPTLPRLFRIHARLEENKLAAAQADADDLFQAENLDGSQWHELAGIYAELAEKAVEAGQEEQMAARAVASLRNARDASHIAALAPHRDPKFKSLLGRPDFRKLCPVKSAEE